MAVATVLLLTSRPKPSMAVVFMVFGMIEGLSYGAVPKTINTKMHGSSMGCDLFCFVLFFEGHVQ